MNRLRKRSKRTEALYVERRKLVERLLQERQWCEYAQPQHPSQVIHEVILRSHGANILDEELCRALCHVHHRYVHDHPAESYKTGWLKRRFGD